MHRAYRGGASTDKCIGVGLAQISWLPHEQRAIQEERKKAGCVSLTGGVRSDGEIAQSSILKMQAIQEGRLCQLERRAAVMLVPPSSTQCKCSCQHEQGGKGGMSSV